MQNSIQSVQILIIGLSVALAACEQRLPSWNDGKLVVIVPDTAQGAEAEFERELAQLFADRLHVTLDTVSTPRENVRSALRKHKAHFAAASLRAETDLAELKFGPDYQTVRELVICNRSKSFPKQLAVLATLRLAVISNSPQETALRAAQPAPAPNWEILHGLTTQDLLTKVADGSLDCTIANELQFADALNYHPNLVVAFDIGSPSKLAWGFPSDADPVLLGQVQAFFTQIRQDGTLNRLLDRYYGHSSRLGSVDAAAFITGINTVLPRYRHLFVEAAAITGVDWRLLAALAYQESQWDPLATSYTNVRGMMMLTEDTADRMKVENRLDARESILAGARYLALLKEQMPPRIPEPDRTWLALAAYNQGYSHLEDARVLTQRARQNPDSWADVKKWMPYLNLPNYHKDLKHGYARGGEAVILVENIRSYYDMLKRLKPDQAPADPDTISYRLIEPLQRLLDYSR